MSYLRKLTALLLPVLLLAAPPWAHPYSVLSHEQVVDQCWRAIIVPMLESRFGPLTPDQVREAHSYAYGGSVIQDIGYYPHGSHEMSDLMHYTRTADFVRYLLQDAATPDEMAFALGALAHYVSDTLGHPQATNVVTALEYPQLAAKYGTRVTYDEDPTAHTRTEFGFDVVEVAAGDYQEQAYRDFIGFRVATALLNRAFLQTYGVPVTHLVKDEEKSINTYRHDVSVIVPEATRIAWITYKKQIRQKQPNATAHGFRYHLRRTEYEREWGGNYQGPTEKEKLLAFLVRILPKVGPLKALKLKLPTDAEQDIYRQSLLNVVAQYKLDLAAAGHPETFRLAELNLDTGRTTAPGEYKLADETYAKLALQLADTPAAVRDGSAQAGVLEFYSMPTSSENFVARNPGEWQKLQNALATLRSQISGPQAATPAPAGKM